ncbi:MIF4G domain-containing protein-like isoform X2 [Ornithodoros turicata]|uniref:MIF4G domain-containing protein-like isoform X2 n=1 Tax=Ornithodoros turicata TaxID=34597 RepID=UPI00313A4C3F
MGSILQMDRLKIDVSSAYDTQLNELVGMLSNDVPPPSPGLNMEHGFVRRIEENQMNRHYQMKEDALRRSETAKLARRVGMPNKSTKPTIEIYRPPGRSRTTVSDGRSLDTCASAGVRVNSEACNGIPPYCQEEEEAPRTVHFQVPPAVGIKEPRSALRRSKSFSHDEVAPLERGVAFAPGCQELLKKALNDPNTMSSQQLMELVRAICTRATEGIQYAEPSAQLCLSIIEKERGETFVVSLVHACREWFNERDALLRGETATSIPRRWTAYVTFLAELFLGLRKRLPPSGETYRPASRTLTLVMLLYDCCHIILKPPSLYNAAEMECLRSVLTISGKLLERESGQRMLMLVSAMRNAFLLPTLAAQIRKTLLELIELHASGWQFSLPQRAYHFPYTSIERT